MSMRTTQEDHAEEELNFSENFTVFFFSPKTALDYLQCPFRVHFNRNPKNMKIAEKLSGNVITYIA